MIRFGNIDDKENQTYKMAYLGTYGMHFNKKACDFAISIMMRMNHTDGRLCHAEPMSRIAIEKLLYNYEIVLDNSVLYDHVYAANKIKALAWQSSIPDEKHLALAIKDVVDDIDQNDGFIFNRWLSDMQNSGVNIDWKNII